MIGRRFSVILGLLAGLTLASSAWAEGGSLKRLDRIRVTAGYIDAHFAVSPDGKTLAYAHVGEGKHPTFLHVVSIKGRRHRNLAKVNITRLTVDIVKMMFSPDGSRLFLVADMKTRTAHPPRQAWVFDRAGRQVGHVQRFTRLAFRRDGKGPWTLVAYLRKAQGGRIAHVITLYNLASLRRTKSARLVASAAGQVAKPRMQIAYFSPDFTRIIAKVAGQYDRKRDVRLPDREKTYNPFTRKFESDREIANLAAWAKFRKIRAAAPGVPVLLRLKGSQKAFTFEMIAGTHQRARLSDLTPPLKQLNFKSLNAQPTASGAVPFSLRVDPQWPTLFGQRKNVPEVFHLFRLNPKTRQIQHLGSISSPKQVLGWRLGGRRLVIMRLHRFWKLGHRVIEIYDVPAARR